MVNNLYFRMKLRTVPFASPSEIFRTNGKRSHCHSRIFHRNDLKRNVLFTFWKWFVNSTQPKVCFSTFEFRELVKTVNNFGRIARC